MNSTELTASALHNLEQSVQSRHLYLHLGGQHVQKVTWHNGAGLLTCITHVGRRQSKEVQPSAITNPNTTDIGSKPLGFMPNTLRFSVIICQQEKTRLRRAEAIRPGFQETATMASLVLSQVGDGRNDLKISPDHAQVCSCKKMALPHLHAAPLEWSIFPMFHFLDRRIGQCAGKLEWCH